MVNLIYPRSIIVPTDDDIVVKQLRELHEPMCYFGEGPAERRERLAKVLSGLDPETRQKLQSSVETKTIESKDHEQIFFYEGSDALKRARFQIANYSIRQSNFRLDMARIKQLEPMSTRLIPQQETIEKLRLIEDLGSYVDDDTSSNELKTLTSCSFNSSGNLLATSCRSGKCKIWTVPDMESHQTFKGHQTSANFITFSPQTDNELSPEVANLASCAMDGSVNLWNLVSEEPFCKLSGPQNWRVTRIRYHPCGQFLTTCCSDRSWRLWDIGGQTEILHQEGHADDVFDIAFHPDGSLAGSASMDSYARVWDLRTGRSIMLLEGHTRGIRSIDFSPDGYHLATGGLDNSVKIWNLRQRRLEYTIPAHINTVTTVMFEKENGFYLATASFDKTVKFWSNQTWAPLKTLDAYDDKVTKFDLTISGNFLASCHFKYVKLWTIGD